MATINRFTPNTKATVSITSGLTTANVAFGTTKGIATQCYVYNDDATNSAFVEFGDSTVAAVVPSGATPGSMPIGPREQILVSISQATTYAASICLAGTPLVYFTPCEGT